MLETIITVVSNERKRSDEPTGGCNESRRSAHLESRPPDERIAPTLLLWWIGEADPICQVPGEGGNGILIQIGGGPRLAINRVATRQREGLDVCAYDVHERNRKELGTRKRSRRRAVES